MTSNDKVQPRFASLKSSNDKGDQKTAVLANVVRRQPGSGSDLKVGKTQKSSIKGTAPSKSLATPGSPAAPNSPAISKKAAAPHSPAASKSPASPSKTPIVTLKTPAAPRRSPATAKSPAAPTKASATSKSIAAPKGVASLQSPAARTSLVKGKSPAAKLNADVTDAPQDNAKAESRPKRLSAVKPGSSVKPATKPPQLDAPRPRRVSKSKESSKADPQKSAGANFAAGARETNGARGSSRDEFAPLIEYVKPANQLQLSVSELNEEIARSLNAVRGGPSRTIMRYNLEEKVFKAEPQLEQTSMHFSAEGHLVLRESEEGQRILKMHTTADDADAKAEEQVRVRTADSGTGPAEDSSSKRLRNQFNFSERGAQTNYFPPKERGANTDPPETAQSSGSCSQWEIYDAYIADQKQQRLQEESQKQKASSKADRSHDSETPRPHSEAWKKEAAMESEPLHSAAKILERMGVQNYSADIVLDFKYWEDEADAIRRDEGTLLPLWKFDCSLTKEKQVTSVSWSATYKDFFVATFGSFDFQKQTSGLVLGFSLKNPSYPECLFRTKSGALTAECHPQHPHLLAVACRDGSVLVFDVRKKQANALVYSSSPTTGQHSRPVWAVAWQAEQHGSPLAFHSLSSDGKLLLWTLATAELRCQEVFRLTQGVPKGLHPEEEASRPELAAGCCMDFHPEQEFLVIVGTEEGAIYKCSTAHQMGYLLTYRGHEMSVYAVRWCRLQPDIFLSASADWTVKLWHTNEVTAVMSFNMGSAIGDIAWSPYSATIFAAVTDDGSARVYDLSQNDSEPLCEQKLVAKTGLARVAFNPRLDIMLIGDDRGQVAVLKTSPNLRRYAKGDTAAAKIASERQRLEAVLSVARKRAGALEAVLALP